MAKQPTTAALASKAIRAEIKAAFPGVPFKIRSENYSGGNSVNVYIGNREQIEHPVYGQIWKNETGDKVMEMIRKYQYGHFDGMNDIYEYSNDRKDIPQVKFVFVNPIEQAKYL